MQTANILLALGGDTGNTVPKRAVTAAEIAVLRAIHGEGSVTDIEPVGDINQSNRAELGRLRQNYGRAMDSENNSIVAQLFPGAAARVFETLDELDLDQSFYKPITRASAKPLFGGRGDHDKNGEVGGAAPLTPAPEGLEALTVVKLKELADSENIPLGEATKKADIIAAIEVGRAAAAAPAEEVVEVADEPDGVADMDDANTDDALFK